MSAAGKVLLAVTQWMQSCSRPKAVWDSRDVISAVVFCLLPPNFSPTLNGCCLMDFGFAGMTSCRKCFSHHTHNTTPTMWLKMIHISGDNILLVCLISSGCSASTLWLSWWKDNLLLTWPQTANFSCCFLVVSVNCTVLSVCAGAGLDTKPRAPAQRVVFTCPHLV